MSDPSHKGNGQDAGEIPAFQLFNYSQKDETWVEVDPVTGDNTPIEKEEIIDRLDIDDEEEES